MPPVPKTPLLEGVTVLNLASVGPAARASRTLADFGLADMDRDGLARHLRDGFPS